jgi:hypothetical protein
MTTKSASVWWGVLVLAALLSISMAVGVDIGRAQRAKIAAPKEPRHLVYLISVSRMDTLEGNKWYVEYSVDGRYEGVPLPVKKGEPEGYLAYIDSLRNAP